MMTKVFCNLDFSFAVLVIIVLLGFLFAGFLFAGPIFAVGLPHAPSKSLYSLCERIIQKQSRNRRHIGEEHLGRPDGPTI